MNKVIKQCSLAMLLIAGGMSYIQAATVSPVVTDAQDLIVKKFAASTISIKPVMGMVAGSYPAKTKVADVTIISTGGSAALRWTPGAGTLDGTAKNSMQIAGKNTGNTAYFSFGTDVSTGSSVAMTESVSSPEWWYSNTDAANITTQIFTTLPGTALVNDAYLLSLDTAVWVE